MVYSFQVVWKKFHGFLSINSHITKNKWKHVFSKGDHIHLQDPKNCRTQVQKQSIWLLITCKSTKRQPGELSVSWHCLNIKPWLPAIASLPKTSTVTTGRRKTPLLPLIMVFSNSHHFLQAGSSLALPLFVSCSLSLLSIFHVPATAAFILPYFSCTNLFFQLVFNSLYVFKGIIYLVTRTGPDFSHQHPGTCTNILLWLSTDNQRLSLTRFQAEIHFRHAHNNFLMHTPWL